MAPDGDPTMLLSACALLTLMVGAILVLASICRLGFVASFISEPVLVGFKAGIGAVIIIDQLPEDSGHPFRQGFAAAQPAGDRRRGWGICRGPPWPWVC